MRLPRHLLRLLGPIGTLASLHGVLVFGRDDLALRVLALAMGINLALSLLTGGSRGERLIFAAAAVFLLLLDIVATEFWPYGVTAVVLLPLLINFWLMVYFGRTLFGGRLPLISRLSTLSRGYLPEELVRYTRALTWVWTAYFATMTALTLIAGLLADLSTWSWLINVGGPLTAVLLFVGEHSYRAVRFRQLGQNSLLHTLNVMARPDTWSPQ